MTEDQLRRQSELLAGRTIVVNMRRDVDDDLIAFAKERGLFVRVDRRTKYGNPFVVGKDGDRDEVCDQYAAYLAQNEELQSRVHELRGKALGCWCWPERCHAMELARLANDLPG